MTLRTILFMGAGMFTLIGLALDAHNARRSAEAAQERVQAIRSVAAYWQMAAAGWKVAADEARNTCTKDAAYREWRQ